MIIRAQRATLKVEGAVSSMLFHNRRRKPTHGYGWALSDVHHVRECAGMFSAHQKCKTNPNPCLQEFASTKRTQSNPTKNRVFSSKTRKCRGFDARCVT